MYFEINNKLYNKYRCEINYNDMDNDMIIIFKSEFKQINTYKCIYLNYYILELDLINYDNIIEKYFILCNSYDKLNELKKNFDNICNSD